MRSWARAHSSIGPAVRPRGLVCSPSAKPARHIARQARTDAAEQVALDVPRRRLHLRQLLAQQRHPAGAAGKENGIDRFRCDARRLQHRLHRRDRLADQLPNRLVEALARDGLPQPVRDVEQVDLRHRDVRQRTFVAYPRCVEIDASSKAIGEQRGNDATLTHLGDGRVLVSPPYPEINAESTHPCLPHVGALRALPQLLLAARAGDLEASKLVHLGRVLNWS